ncbi:hypothetical protein FB451DRAFT_1564789 [Mycena latifolia]|nr:hypothetical protein FB451DRAFT_1564789 [Mycena latifolia]
MDPILATLVQSNERLSEPQALHVQQILDDTLTALWDVEKKISAVLLSLLKLEKERRLRSEYAGTLKGVLSPIRRIPSEILAEIFLLCRDGSLDASKYSVADPRQAPMLLGSVSSRWRQVSHSTPRLWDHIHLQRTSDRTNPTEDILLSILASSRILPLHVKLEMEGPRLPSGPTDADVLDLLFHQAHRFKDVHLLIFVDLPPRIFDKRTLPVLSSIQIVVGGRFDITPFLPLFNNAPQLRSLSMKGYCPSILSLVFALPWSQLTRLKLVIPIAVSQARDILAQCGMMQDCEFEQLIKSDDLSPSQHVYQLNHLGRFAIYIEDDEPHPERFFEAFSFPKLNHLNIWAESTSWSPHILLDLQARSNFTLTYLELHRMNLLAEDLIRFLQHLPSLRVLDVSYCCIDDALFKAFTFDPQYPLPPFALQRLESLSVHEDTDGDRLDGALIADMVESVCAYSGGNNPAFPALETVHLWLEGPTFDAEVEARLLSACATGFVVDHFNRD